MRRFYCSSLLLSLLFALLCVCVNIRLHAMSPLIILDESQNTIHCKLLRACNGIHENVPAVQSALTARADVNLRTFSFHTPLHYAVNNDYQETAQLLISHKADLEARAAVTAQVTPLFCSLREGHTAIARMLVENKADINGCTGRDDEPPLYTAITRNHLDIAKLICFRGAQAISDKFERRLSPGEQEYIRERMDMRKCAQTLLYQKISPLFALLPVQPLVLLVNDYATSPELSRIITEEQANLPYDSEPRIDRAKRSRCRDCAIS